MNIPTVNCSLFLKTARTVMLPGFLTLLIFSVCQRDALHLRVADQKAEQINQIKANSSSNLQTLPKFGEEPTNRVLPVDHLTSADYIDEPVDENEKNYCSKVIRRELEKSLRRRKSRQEDEEGVDAYLDFDATQILRPLVQIMRGAAARNATMVDESYKTLPTYTKNQVKEFFDLMHGFIDVLKPSV